MHVHMDQEEKPDIELEQLRDKLKKADTEILRLKLENERLKNDRDLLVNQLARVIQGQDSNNGVVVKQDECPIGQSYSLNRVSRPRVSGRKSLRQNISSMVAGSSSQVRKNLDCRLFYARSKHYHYQNNSHGNRDVIEIPDSESESEPPGEDANNRPVEAGRLITPAPSLSPHETIPDLSRSVQPEHHGEAAISSRTQVRRCLLSSRCASAKYVLTDRKYQQSASR